MSEITVRNGELSDLPYIIATWLHHYKSHSYFAKRIRRSSFFPFHHKIVEGILNRSATEIYIAHPTGSPEVIFGFLVVERGQRQPVIHFAFVKQELRKMGIGRKMIEESQFPIADAQFTHWTYDADPFKKRFPNLNYNPYLI